MLITITVVGAILVSSLMKDTLLIRADEDSTFNVFAHSIKLTGYDTRDSEDLSGINNLDNQFNLALCTVSCKLNDNVIPSNNGTEFLVLNLRNKNVNSININNIQINEIVHTWDFKTGGEILDASNNDPDGGSYPFDGKYSIIPTSNNLPILQREQPKVAGDEEVRLVIKLSDILSQDVNLGKSMRVKINIGTSQTPGFIIQSGDIRG